MADRRVWVEYSPSMMEPVRPGAVSPDRALCLPTFSHFVTVNKTSLSLSLSQSVFPWDGRDGRSPVSHPTCDVPFPPRRSGRYRKGMISAHSSCQGVRIGLDPETFAPGQTSRAEARPTGRAVSRERLGDWDGPMAV